MISPLDRLQHRLSDAITEARALANSLQEFRRTVSIHGDAIKRMREGQMPFITSQINEANDLSEDVAGRLPDLKEDIAEADREYTRGRQKVCGFHPRPSCSSSYVNLNSTLHVYFYDRLSGWKINFSGSLPNGT